MSSIPQQQFVNAFDKVKSDYIARQRYGLNGMYVLRGHEFGRGYIMFYDGKKCMLKHYGTLIYECDFKTKKFKIGGWSKSDADAINSMGRITGIGGAYIQNGTLYAEGTGPRYKKKTAGPKTNGFGLAKM